MSNASNPSIPKLGLTEEDDEFEEFEVEDWTAADEDQDEASMWDDHWDNDDLDDEFTMQLRAELVKADAAKQHAGAQGQGQGQGQEQQQQNAAGGQ
ncbi:hypothetical protein HDU93_004483 [Gonapodya sp. JEL0774]|nr:hypothetical protein HDU93_004483 [Gonapodya sp. JEL0774]